MARGVKEGPNRSEFIRNQLKANKKVKHKEVVEAWKKAGHDGEIKATLYYLVKSKMKGKRGPKREDASSQEPADANSKDTVLLDMEKQLDKLIVAASLMRDSKLADDLRIARRRVSALLV